MSYTTLLSSPFPAPIFRLHSPIQLPTQNLAYHPNLAIALLFPPMGQQAQEVTPLQGWLFRCYPTGRILAAGHTGNKREAEDTNWVHGSLHDDKET